MKTRIPLTFVVIPMMIAMMASSAKAQATRYEINNSFGCEIDYYIDWHTSCNLAPAVMTQDNGTLPPGGSAVYTIPSGYIVRQVQITGPSSTFFWDCTMGFVDVPFDSECCPSEPYPPQCTLSRIQCAPSGATRVFCKCPD